MIKYYVFSENSNTNIILYNLLINLLIVVSMEKIALLCIYHFIILYTIYMFHKNCMLYLLDLYTDDSKAKHVRIVWSDSVVLTKWWSSKISLQSEEKHWLCSKYNFFKNSSFEFKLNYSNRFVKGGSKDALFQGERPHQLNGFYRTMSIPIWLV